MDQSEEAALKWAKSAKMPWPHVLPKNARKSGLSKFNRDSMANLYVLIDKDGKKLATDKAECFQKIAELTK